MAQCGHPTTATGRRSCPPINGRPTPPPQSYSTPPARLSYHSRLTILDKFMPAPSPFAKIPKIEYEGPKSKNPLAFKHYNPNEKVEGKTMKDHLRFSVTYWHTFRGMGADMFGVGTAIRP